jgi:hypothetical protein
LANAKTAAVEGLRSPIKGVVGAPVPLFAFEAPTLYSASSRPSSRYRRPGAEGRYRPGKSPTDETWQVDVAFVRAAPQIIRQVKTALPS